MFNRLLEMLNGIIDTDFAEQPNFTFRVKLRETLYAAGFNKHTVDTFVLSIKVSLSPKLTDTQVELLATLYAKLYFKMHALVAGSCWQGIQDVEERFLALIATQPLEVSCS